MNSINRVVMCGRAVSDPQDIGNGKGVQFALALDGGYKDKSGEWKDVTHFVDTKIWGPQANNVKEMVSKGTLAAVDGSLEQERWEKDGQKRSKLVVKAYSVQVMQSRKSGPSDAEAPGESNGESDQSLPF